MQIKGWYELFTNATDIIEKIKYYYNNNENKIQKKIIYYILRTLQNFFVRIARLLRKCVVSIRFSYEWHT